MPTFTEADLSALLMDITLLRTVEPSIYTVLPEKDTGNVYDTRFGFIYDLVACNPIYNRLVWGYSSNIFTKIVTDALQSMPSGNVLDLGCGSLAFSAKAYAQLCGRPVVLADRSLNMLRMAKSRLVRCSGKIPENIIFLHLDALQLPFKENAFTTVIAENLLHCLDDTSILLRQLKNITSVNGGMYFTTLVKNNRLADKYLQTLADTGEIIARTMADHQEIFARVGLAATFTPTGNLVSIHCQNAKR